MMATIELNLAKPSFRRTESSENEAESGAGALGLIGFLLVVAVAVLTRKQLRERRD